MAELGGSTSQSAEMSEEAPNGESGHTAFVEKGEQLLLNLTNTVKCMQKQQSKMTSIEQTVQSLQAEIGKMKRKNQTTEEPDTVKKKKTDDKVGDSQDKAPTKNANQDHNLSVDEFLNDDDSSSEEDEMETDFIEQLGHFFEVKAETSEKVSDGLAKVSNEGLRAPVDENKLKELQEKHLHPENIDNLQVPLVDNTLWRQLPRELRARDVQYQKETVRLSSALVPIIRTLDALKAKDQNTQQKVKEHAANAFKMLCMYINAVQHTRKERIKKELLPKYKNICDTKTTATKLFGEDLKDEIKQRTYRDQALTTHRQQIGASFLGRRGVGQQQQFRRNTGPPYKQQNRQSNLNTRHQGYKKGQNHKNPGFRK